MTAQSKQYSPAAGVVGFDSADASVVPFPTPMAGCEPGQQADWAQCT
jgi:hypothetical protein